MAFTGALANYTSSVKWAAVTAWSNNGGAGTAYTAGDLRKQTGTPTAGNERVYVALNGGTGGTGADPLTTFTRGVKITDAGVTWQEVTGQPALNGDMGNTPNWTNGAKNTAITLGHVIKDVAGTHIFICTTAGTSGNGAEPTWSVGAVGNTTTDNTVTWTYLGTSFGAWAAPHARLYQATQTNWGDITSCKFFVGSDHNSTNTVTESLVQRGSDILPVYYLCVDVAGSLPPVSADLRTTAVITNTTGGVPNNNGWFIMYGITFVGVTTSGDMPMNADSKPKFYEACGFQLGAGASSGSTITFGNGGGAFTELKNCKFKLTNVGHKVQTNGVFIWRDTAAAIDTGTVPTTFFSAPNSAQCYLSGLDLSAIVTGKALIADAQAAPMAVYLRDCKLSSTFTFRSASNTTQKVVRDRLSRSSSSGINYALTVADYDGAQSVDTTVVRTGGASDNVTSVAWKIVTTANPHIGRPFSTAPFSKWNAVTVSNVVVTVYGIINAAAVPNNNELWLEVDYLGDASSPQSSNKNTRIADFLASAAALTADTSAWDSVAAARQNTHTYTVGDTIKVATNPGRLFFCTASSGNNAGSEPAGYASAVDGGSVTDGSATFRAGCRFKMAVTLTSPQPQLAGQVYAKVCAAKVSTTYYIDPYIALS